MTTPSPKAVSRSVLMWAFGLTVSILLIALWGRAIVVDSDRLAESLSPLSESGVVADYVTDWMVDQLADVDAAPSPAVRSVMESSVGQVLDGFVAEVVLAAASTNPGGSTVDMAHLVSPAVPDLTIGFASLGFPVSESQVQSLVAGLDPLVIREPGADALIGPASTTAARLGTAVLLAAIGLVVFGGGVIWLSDDRTAAVRSLVTRVAVGGLTFAVLLRLGAWVLDPGGGRAPLPATVSGLAGSKWMVPLQLAVVAGLVSGGIYVVKRWMRRGEASPSPNGKSTPQSEQSESLSGSR